MSANQQITEKSLALFLDLARDAGNWSGMPLFGGNVGNEKADQGNLTQLKQAGLVKTEQDGDNRRCFWVIFTAAGRELAKQHGINIEYWA